MSDERHYEGLPEEARQALSALGRLPRAVPSDAARARARAAFLDGTEIRSLPRRRRGRWAGLLLAASFLGTMALVLWGRQPAAHWRVLDAVGEPGYAVGQRVDPTELALGPGQELELQLGDEMRFRLLPQTRLTLPSPPGRLIGGPGRVTVHAGEIFGTTGGGRLLHDWRFGTEELEARLTGTTFAVFRTDSASCVCLWEGGIRVTDLVGGHDATVLEPEQRVWIYRDGRVPEVLPLTDMEVMKLTMMRDAGIAPVEAP